MRFSPGIKAYLEEPRQILQMALPACSRCSAAAWHVHGQVPRSTSDDGTWRRTVIFRLRCGVCRLTTRLLPDFMRPGLQHGMPTVASTCQAYLAQPTSYRRVALATADVAVPAGESLSTLWSGPRAPSPVPSSIFRWLDRFARSTGAWWQALAPAVQARMTTALSPPAPPDHLRQRARTAAKANALAAAWHLLWLLGSDWPDLLRRAPRHPDGLDHTGLFLRHVLAPP